MEAPISRIYSGRRMRLRNFERKTPWWKSNVVTIITNYYYKIRGDRFEDWERSRTRE